MQAVPHAGQPYACAYMVDVGGGGGCRGVAKLCQQPLGLQPGLRGRAADGGVVAAPGPLVWQGADACAHGVEAGVAGQFQQVGFALHDDGFKAALKDMAYAPIRAVVGLGVHAVELAHACAQVAVHRLDNDVVVVVHQAVGVAGPVVALADLGKKIEPLLAVGIVQVNGLAPVAA